MIKFLVCLLGFLLINQGFAQTFSSSPSLFINSNATQSDIISVTGIGTIDCDYGLSQVCIDLTHTYDADLSIFLEDPAGNIYALSTNNGGSANDYSVTCFDMTAATAIAAGTAPFNGSFIPEGDIGAANDGQDADGDWELIITDGAGGDEGTLLSWDLVFSANPECGPEPTPEDCAGGETVCSDEVFSGNSNGSGNVADLRPSNDGCLNGEHESSWYYFQAASDGTYAFIITTLVDYDFAVWGPFTDVECIPPGPLLRCSYSGTAGNTGLQAGAGDTSEGAGGDAVVDPIVALEDDVYVICIDNFTSDGTAFLLDWTLTGGASFDCSLLPIELKSFTATGNNGTNFIDWTTASELNCSHYIIERSADGEFWEELGTVPGAGNSTSDLTYQFRDVYNNTGLVYYRLTQVDFDGGVNLLGTVWLDNANGKEVDRIVNLMGQEVDESYDGLKVYIYTDGSILKVVSE